MAHSITFIKTPYDKTGESKIFTAALDRIGFVECDYYQYLIDIDPQQEYMLAVDQSLSSTGVALASIDFSFVAVFTIVNGINEILLNGNYIQSILEFIRNMLDGKRVKFRALESVPPSKYSRVRQKLDPLKGAIESGLDRIPAIQSLDKNYKFEVMPNVWKSAVYDKKGKGRGAFNNKQEIAQDIVKIYPELQPYFTKLYKLSGHDFDGFDAFGLLIYTRVKCFTPDWFLINKSGRYQLGKFHVLFCYLTYEEASVEMKLMKPLAYWAAHENLDSRIWNAEESIFYNLLMAANTNKVICMECTSIKQIIAFLIEFEVEYNKNKTLYVVVGKAIQKLITDNQAARLQREGFYLKTYFKE